MILVMTSKRERFRQMKVTALRARQVHAEDAFERPARDLMPLWWSVPIWLVASVATWAAVIYAGSLFF
jgi:hypothetical protein